MPVSDARRPRPSPGRTALKARSIPLVALAGFAMLLAACSDDSDTPASTNAAAPAAPVATATAALSAEAGPVLEDHELSSWYRSVLINPAAISDPRELEAIARPYCEGLETCRVGLWYDRQDFPTAMPVREIQLRYQVFAFGRTIDGSENALWNCNVFPEFEAERLCLPRPL